ncbi:hypothetical protein EV644_12439 [Kribbella orskensis]|uniref:Uncharacterized protein n=1 Tax=Kribbella orskensis TaxID=2512216 RepID=A0ABY2B9Q0_9ACTN|nr:MULTISPECIES: hypothetical protein [Kribbella]TCN32767.1 hypothetical protein EV642_12659 [Kribbella sp. VKM Ac-2500]TCO12915.1 hypothetical protein EV644_12439 [Kribbella orskensis]
MTTEQTTPDDQKKTCPSCDLTELDTLQCEAEGIKKQAELTEKAAADVKKRRTLFDQARKEYSAARDKANPLVTEMESQLDKLIEQIKCRIKDDDVVECLEKAQEKVRRSIDKCMPPGCCVDAHDCDFDKDVPKKDKVDEKTTESDQGSDAQKADRPTILKDLYARQADVERRTVKAEACFDKLIKEPTALPARVDKLKAELAAIVGELGQQEAVDLKRLYARALVARHTDRWGGFDNVNEFMDCLCKGLLCSLNGRKALAELAGCIAVLECQEREAGARCQHLLENTVDEILAEYLRTCKKPPKDVPTPDPANC